MNDYRNEEWANSMRIRYDYNNMMQSSLGERGISAAELEALPLSSCFESLTHKRPEMRWRELPYNQEAVVCAIERCAEGIRKDFDAFVVLGIGGSALGPIAVHQALCHPRYNELPADKRKGPKLYVEDNIDPERIAALFDVIDVKRTMFNVVTKSGSTSETMSQLLIITDALHKALGSDISSNLIATTDKAKGNLVKIVKAENLTSFIVPDGVGGRFSELCPVGLLAAAVCGIDIRELLSGAAYMDELCKNPDIYNNPACMFGALQYASMQRGCNIHVMMPYADSLKYISDWYAQLWAESLGKRNSLDGRPVHAGQTPVKALGVTDQHSQVQLYTEGPFDKVISFISVDRFHVVTPIPLGYPDIPDVCFLSGHTLNELIAAECKATEYAVTKSGHINNLITLPEVNAFTIGQLLYMLEVATAFTGELLDINAFDQPGVEEGKNATYALLGKRGYDEKRVELAAAPEKSPEYIIR